METQQINFRVTNELRNAWMLAARSMRVKPTEFARFAIAEKIAAMSTGTKTAIPLECMEVQHDYDPQPA